MIEKVISQFPQAGPLGGSLKTNSEEKI